jgi:hypothetical protein
MLESLAREKHSSLLRKCVNYGRKMLYNIDPKVEMTNAVSLKYQIVMKQRVFMLYKNKPIEGSSEKVNRTLKNNVIIKNL